MKFFEFENREGRESKRGILAMKYFLKWRGDSSIQQFLDMRKQFEEDAGRLCENEIIILQWTCGQTKQWIEDTFTLGK